MNRRGFSEIKLKDRGITGCTVGSVTSGEAVFLGDGIVGVEDDVTGESVGIGSIVGTSMRSGMNCLLSSMG